MPEEVPEKVPEKLEAVKVPVADKALLIVVVPVKAPKLRLVAAPPIFRVVTVELSRLKLVAELVKSAPLTARSPVKVVSPVTARVEDRVVALVTPRVEPKVAAPETLKVPDTSKVLVGELVPIPTESVEVERDIEVPESVHPPAESREEVAIVNFLLVVSGVIEMPVPAAKVRVSVFEPAEKEVEPTVTVLKIFCEEPVSSLVIVSPEMLIPVPAVKVKAPVLPCRDNTPVFLMAGDWPEVTEIPSEAVSE